MSFSPLTRLRESIYPDMGVAALKGKPMPIHRTCTHECEMDRLGPRVDGSENNKQNLLCRRWALPPVLSAKTPTRHSLGAHRHHHCANRKNEFSRFPSPVQLYHRSNLRRPMTSAQLCQKPQTTLMTMHYVTGIHYSPPVWGVTL